MSLAFVGAGVFILSRDASEPIGWIAIFFFGGCGLIGLVELIGYQRKPVDDVSEEGQLVVRRSRTHGFVYSLASIGMAAGTVLLSIFEQIHWFWAVVALGLFGIGGIFLFYATLRNRPLLTIDSTGIQWQGKAVPWELVRGYSVVSMNGNDCLCLNLRDPGFLRSQQSFPGRILSAINQSAGFGHAHVPLSGTDVDRQQIVAIIDEMLRLMPQQD